MTIAQLPSKTSFAIQEKMKNTNPQWTRILAAGSLVTGAVLLATGKRKAGVVLSAVGATAAVLDDLDSAKDFWNGLPGYIQNGQQFLERVEHFVEEIAEQGERVRKMVNQQIR